MPVVDIKLHTKPMRDDSGMIRKLVEQAIHNGDIRLEIKSGSDDLIVHPASFTIDKRKYSLRLSDETEDSVKVHIEPKG